MTEQSCRSPKRRLQPRGVMWLLILILMQILTSLFWAWPVSAQEEVKAIQTAEDLRRAKLLAEQQASKNVVVDIELERAPEIKKYELEVLNIKDKKSLTFTQADPNFSVPLLVGRYKLRSRMSSREETSPWSEWLSLEAQPDTARFFNLTEKYIISKKERSALVNLNWDYANGAQSYRLWFEKLAAESISVAPDVETSTQKAASSSSKIKKIETIANSFSAKLPIGRYRIGIQSVASGGIVSEVRYHENPIEVAFATLPKIKVKSSELGEYSWDRLDGARVRVAIFHKPFFGQEFKLLSETVVPMENWKFPTDAKPGEYRIQFSYVSEEIQNGEVETLFFVKRPGQKEFDESRADQKPADSPK